MSIKAMSAVFDIGRELDLSSADRLVLLALADHADDKYECWPSYDKLAVKCGLTRRSAIYAIDRLLMAGLLEKTARKGKTGSPQSNTYRLTFIDRVVKPVAPGVVQSTSLPSEAHCTTLVKPTAPESSIEPSVEPPSPPIDGFADAYKTAFDSIFPDPYVWHRADFVQLKTWRGDYPAIGPERFVEVAKTEWRKGQYCKGSSLTIRGLCTSWAQIVAGQQVGNGQAPGDGMARFHEKQARLDKERREQEAARAPAPAPV